MSSDVTIIIKAVDKASAEFKKLEGAAGGLGATFKGLGVAAASAGAVIGAGVAVWKATVAPIINYNKSILDAARSTRMGTEDLSRFIQVGDDVDVGMDSITRALQMATKNGFEPSIAAIADLADKANAMNTPTERAAMLAKMFGRNWAELDPILQLGGQRIRELAAAQADGLVATEAEIKKTEELRLALDEIADEWTALKNEIGLGVGRALVKGRQESERFASQMNAALAVVRSQGLEPTRKNIDEMFRRLTDGFVLGEVFRIRDALDQLDGKTVDVNIFEHRVEAGFEHFTSGQDVHTLTERAAYNAAAAARKDEEMQGEGQYGLDTIVPPGFPNDRAIYGASSGERVQITPAGEKAAGGFSGTLIVQTNPLDLAYVGKIIKRFVGM